jgi:hypothetical protein
MSIGRAAFWHNLLATLGDHEQEDMIAGKRT